MFIIIIIIIIIMFSYIPIDSYKKGKVISVFN
jgi:hypothetical protein